MSSAAATLSSLERLVQRAQRLYSLPAVAMKVVQLTASSHVDTRALKECIEQDPALTTKILRVVNSSLFGFSRGVTDLNQALVLLGVKPLRLLVLGFSLPKALLSNVESSVLQIYWRHALTKAVAAREIADRLWKIPGEEAFIAGLLQDIGVLVLVQELGAPYCQYLERIFRSGEDLCELELAALGFDHLMVGKQLLQNWQLPDVIVEAAGTPLRAEAIEEVPPHRRTLAEILYLADLLAKLLTQERPGILPRLTAFGEQYCGLSSACLESLVQVMDERVPALSEILSLPLYTGDSFQGILMRAHAQLAAAATQAVYDLADPSPQEHKPLLATLVPALDPFAPDRQAEPPIHRGSPPRAPRRESEPAAESSSPLQLVVAGASGLQPFLERSVTQCRAERWPLSLLLVEIDGYDELVRQLGPWISVQAVARVTRLLAALQSERIQVLQFEEARFALVLAGYDRTQAGDLGRRVVEIIRRAPAAGESKPLTLSAGVACLSLPPKNFPPQELFAAAERCLSGARLSGGDALKSIDLS